LEENTMIKKKVLAPAALALAGLFTITACSTTDPGAESSNTPTPNPTANSTSSPDHEHDTQSPSADETEAGTGEVYVLPDSVNVEVTEDGVMLRNYSTDGSTPVDRADVTAVRIYQDIQCPHCKDFESSLGDSVERALDSDQSVSFEYSTLNYLATPWSLATANALTSVADDDDIDQYYLAVQSELFERLPMQEMDRMHAEAQVRIALMNVLEDETKVNEVMEDVKGDVYTNKINTYTEAALTNGGISGTPTVLFDGEKNNDYTAAAEQIKELAAGL
jgi:protein-disulfide isomerase